MKTEWKVFLTVAGFMFGVCLLYAGWTTGDSGRIEWIGTLALGMSSLLCAMCGGFFWFVSRRIDLRPEDRPDGEIADGAGEIGFFSPGSYWPVGVAFAATMAALGLSYTMWWLLAAGLIAVIFTVCGLLFEYYTGTRRTAEH